MKLFLSVLCFNSFIFCVKFVNAEHFKYNVATNEVNYGNGESVNQDKYGAFRRDEPATEEYVSTERKEYLVEENRLRVSRYGRCSIPVPVCQRLPFPDRVFQPECALLHRCAQDFGCCKDSSHQCMVENSEKVTLYFHSYIISELGKSKPEIVSQQYINHTSCSCQRPKYNYPVLHTNGDRTAKRSFAHYSSSCTCPYSFTSEYHHRSCICVCHDRLCKKYRNGRKSFTPKDISCMKHGSCGIPKCRFGDFSATLMRCPTRRESKSYKRSRL